MKLTTGPNRDEDSNITRDPLDHVRRAAAHTAKARVELVEAMAAARDSGKSLREIGDAAGLSHEAVRKLIRKEVNA
jgi:hypothetical protein